eukprot:3688015-Alexandrium_andersonii.AAC.1
MSASLVGSEMCIRDSMRTSHPWRQGTWNTCLQPPGQRTHSSPGRWGSRQKGHWTSRSPSEVRYPVTS